MTQETVANRQKLMLSEWSSSCAHIFRTNAMIFASVAVVFFQPTIIIGLMQRMCVCVECVFPFGSHLHQNKWATNWHKHQIEVEERAQYFSFCYRTISCHMEFCVCVSSFVCFCVNLLGANTAQLPSVSMSFDLFTHIRIVFFFVSFRSLCVSLSTQTKVWVLRISFTMIWLPIQINYELSEPLWSVFVVSSHWEKGARVITSICYYVCRLDFVAPTH